MTIVAGAPPAAVDAAPPRPASRRDDRRRPLVAAGVRLAAAVVWVAVAKLLAYWFLELPVLALLGTTSVAFVTASVLFGWIGLAVAIAMQLVTLWLLQGLGGVYPTASTIAYAIGGAAAWMVFRYVPRLGRGLADLRSLGWYLAAAAFGGLLTPWVISITGHEGHVLQSVALWSRSTVVTLWVFAPALLVLGDRRLRALLAPIPGEARVRPPKRVALVREGISGEALEVVAVQSREEPFGRRTAYGLLMVAAITLLRMVLPGDWSHTMAWLNILYLFPIWWMAHRLRLPGALVGSALVGVGVLAGYAVSLAADQVPPNVSLSIYAQLLSFWLVGVLFARGAEREGRLLEGVAELHGRLEQDLQRVVWALTGAVEAKDAYTSGHLQRVNAFALEVGRRLGLAGRDLELLQIASTLHDIGKIGIPESILNKPGPLDAEERAVMQRHPEIGAGLLMRIEGLREAAPLVLHHQERWDGRDDPSFPGYPHRLAGNEIPLGARIVAVVDSFDAMTTDRPYRRALQPGEARRVLYAERGAQFDPAVV
ncbi:MAG TPA: HD-GYP domain-containing protein, partial [Thermoanaerobaculia bacterium]|nr:HD-GYP domain-containing protein [Thermoanaerobaculia bacterium]